VTGSAKGELLKWQGTAPSKPIKAHDCAIWQLVARTDTTFFSGGNDGIVKQWDATMKLLNTIDLNKTFTEAPGIRSLCIHSSGQKMLVGTVGAQVAEFDMKGNCKSMIVQGHYAGIPAFAEVWGCAVHPTEQKFATCGSDRHVRIWGP
jgi:WD40 repeat protein